MSKATKHLAYVAAGLTCQGAVDILRQIGTGTEDTTRLNALVKPMITGMAFSDGLKFLSDVVASTKVGPDGQASTEGKPDGNIKRRVSEVRQIYAACKMVPGFSIEGMGYWKAYDAAKDALKARNIRASGATILTPEQTAEKAILKTEQDVRAELEALPENAQRTVAQIKEEARKLAAQRVSDDAVVKHAERIVKSNGLDYATRLVAALTKAIVATEQEQAKAEQPEVQEQEQQVRKATRKAA